MTKRAPRLSWLGKLIVVFVGVYGLAAFCLILSWARRDGPWPWTAGALTGAVSYGGYYAGFLQRGWIKTYAERSRSEMRRGRVYYPLGSVIATVVLIALTMVGGQVSVFTIAVTGGVLAATAIWLTVYVPRNWEKVRVRLGAGSPT